MSRKKKKQKVKILCKCIWDDFDIKLVEIQGWVYFIDGGYRHVNNPYTFAYAKCEYIKELALKNLNEAKAILLIGNLTFENRNKGVDIINEFTEVINNCDKFKEILIKNKYKIVSPEEDDRVTSNPELTHEYIIKTFGNKVKPIKDDYLKHLLDINLPVRVNTEFDIKPFNSTEYVIDIVPSAFFSASISNLISTRKCVVDTNIYFLLEYDLFYKLYNNVEFTDDCLINSADEIPYNIGIGIMYKGQIVPILMSIVPNYDVTSIDFVKDKIYTISMCINQITLDPEHYNPYAYCENIQTTNNCIFEFKYNATTNRIIETGKDDVYITNVKKMHKTTLYIAKYVWNSYIKSRQRNSKTDISGIYIPITGNSENQFNKALQSSNLAVPETYNKGYITLREYLDIDRELRKVDKEYKKHSKHSSPREHIRKGFYRKTKNGSLVYVRPTIVNKGKSSDKIIYKIDK